MQSAFDRNFEIMLQLGTGLSPRKFSRSTEKAQLDILAIPRQLLIPCITIQNSFE